jgi:hypothetical protein
MCNTRPRKASIFFFLLLFGIAGPGLAQDATPAVSAAPGIRFVLSGAVQLRASYGLSTSPAGDTDRLGFGVRRARFKANAFVGERSSMFFQAEAASGSFGILDFYGQYAVSKRLSLRLGRLVSAQPRGLILTGLNFIDVADRANVLERWGQTTIGGDGRDFGLDARYRIQNGTLYAFLHNGDGNWSATRGNFRQTSSGSSATGADIGTGMAMTVAASLEPPSLEGFEFGGFAGVNTRENPNTARNGEGRTYATYGAHAYLGARPGSRPIRVKLDLVAIDFEKLAGEQEAQRFFGASIFGAVSPARAVEGFVRFEAMKADANQDGSADQYLTLGTTFSPSALRGGPFHSERVTLAWTRFAPGSLSDSFEDLIVLQLQFVF